MKKYQLIIIVSIFVLFNLGNSCVFANQTNFKQKIEPIIYKYMYALENQDIDTIEKISNKQFVVKTKEFLEGMEAIDIQKVSIKSYKQEKDSEYIKCILEGSYFYRKRKNIISNRLSYRGPVSMEFKKVGKSYYIVATDLYDEEGKGMPNWLMVLMLIVFVIIPIIKGFKKMGTKK